MRKKLTQDLLPVDNVNNFCTEISFFMKLWRRKIIIFITVKIEFRRFVDLLKTTESI